MNKVLLAIVMRVLPFAIKKISEELRSEIVRLIIVLDQKAQRTPNDFDDLFVDLLKFIFEIEK